MKAPWSNEEIPTSVEMLPGLKGRLEAYARKTDALSDADAISELLLWYDETLPIIESIVEMVTSTPGEEDFFGRFQNRQLDALQRGSAR